jgi:hypothetical protein
MIGAANTIAGGTAALTEAKVLSAGPGGLHRWRGADHPYD